MVFVNQMRMKIGVVFGNPETTPGGRALKFYASVRLDIRRVSTYKTGAEVAGNRTRVKVVKNKLAPPFKEVEFDIAYGTGIDHIAEVIDLGIDHGVLARAGTWFAYGDNRIGQGREKVKDFLLEHREILAEIEAKLKEKLAAKKPEPKPAPKEAAPQ